MCPLLSFFEREFNMESHVLFSLVSFLATGVWGGTAGDSSIVGSILVILKHVVQAVGVWGGTAGD